MRDSDSRRDIIIQLLEARGLLNTPQEPWKCGCLVRDPVDETLHWVIQPAWVGRCDKCRHVAPWYTEATTDA